jgi:hypothetical protein
MKMTSPNLSNGFVIGDVVGVVWGWKRDVKMDINYEVIKPNVRLKKYTCNFFKTPERRQFSCFRVVERSFQYQSTDVLKIPN